MYLLTNYNCIKQSVLVNADPKSLGPYGSENLELDLGNAFIVASGVQNHRENCKSIHTKKRGRGITGTRVHGPARIDIVIP